MSLPSVEAKFFYLPFFFPTYCPSSFYRPGGSQFSRCIDVPGWSQLTKGPLHTSALLALPFWLEAPHDAELQGGLVENVFAYPLPQHGLQGPTLSHPTFFHLAAKPIQIRGNESALLCGLPALRNKTLSPCPRMFLLHW